MQFQRQMVFLVLCLAVVGDIGSFFNSMWTGSELVSHNAGLLIPGANGLAPLAFYMPALVKGIAKLLRKFSVREAKKDVKQALRNG